MEVFLENDAVGIHECVCIGPDDTVGVLRARAAAAALCDEDSVVLELCGAVLDADHLPLSDVPDLEFGSEVTVILEDRKLLRAVESGEVELHNCPDRARANPDIVLAAIARSGYLSVMHAARELKADAAFVLRAVTLDPKVLPHVHVSMRGNREVMTQAVAGSPVFFTYASRALRADREFVLGVLRDEPSYYEGVSDLLKDDEELAALAVEGNVRMFALVPLKLHARRAVMLAAVRHDGRHLSKASALLKDDKEVVLAAIAQYSGAVDYATHRLQADRDVRIAAGLPVRRLRDADDPHLADLASISDKAAPRLKNPKRNVAREAADEDGGASRGQQRPQKKSVRQKEREKKETLAAAAAAKGGKKKARA